MKLKKYIAVLLSLVLFCGSFTGVAAAAVTMPENVSEERITNAIPKVESLAQAVLKLNPETSDLNSLVYGLLFSDATLNGIFSGVYSNFADQASTLQTLGVDISVNGLYNCLGDYPDVQAALAGKTYWNEVFTPDFNPKWNVTAKDGFGAALAAMFKPLNELLFTLLCSGSYSPNLLLTVKGADGYRNVIVPILQTLGAPAVMTQADYTAAAAADRSMMLRSVADMLCGAVDHILASPVRCLCDYLPGIARYLVNGGLKESMTTLLEPLRVRVGIFSLSGVDQLLENLGGFSDPEGLSSMLENMDTSALFGSDVDMELPEVDLQLLSECGTVEGDTFVADPAQTFVTVFRWAVEALKMNAARLPDMLGQGAAAGQDLINKLLAKNADELLVMVLDLLELQPSETVLQYRWSYPAYTPGSIVYTPNLTREDYQKVLQGIDSTLNDFMSEFTDNGTLSGTLAARIYSNSLVSQLVVAVYGAVYSENTAGALALLGLDASPAGLAESIAAAYPRAAETLRAAASWQQVNPASLSWGFSNGNKQGFVNAVTAALLPFRPFLTLLLAEGNITLLDTIQISGSNGYNTAVVPLLEALGCNEDQIKTYAAYRSEAGTASAITNILTPITGLLDQLISSPVATLCRILPNLVYFVNAGGLKQCVDNLMYPVRVLLQKIGAEDMLGDALSEITNIDLQKTVAKLMADSGLQLKLPEPDLALLCSLGTAQERVSHRTYNGAAENYVYIASDEPAVLVTVLRYVVGALGSEENAETLSGLFQQDNTSEGDMMAMYTGKVAEQLKTMSTDETIEWLYNLLFAETPKREEPAEEAEEDIPHIIYQETEKHTTRNVSLLIGIGVAVLIALMLVLSRIDFTSRRERKKHLKQKRKQQKVQRKAVVKQAQDEISTAAGGGTAAGPQTDSFGMTEKERLRHEKELMRMRVREEKARQKAYRQTKKADKYYEQALREQQKKKH